MINKEEYFSILRNPYHVYWTDSLPHGGSHEAKVVFEGIQGYFDTWATKSQKDAAKLLERVQLRALNHSSPSGYGRLGVTASMLDVYLAQFLADILEDEEAKKKWETRAIWRCGGFHQHSPAWTNL